jgi:hypothetical protein
MGLTYNTDAYSHGVAIADAITPTDIDAALALVGISDALARVFGPGRSVGRRESRLVPFAKSAARCYEWYQTNSFQRLLHKRYSLIFHKFMATQCTHPTANGPQNWGQSPIR